MHVASELVRVAWFCGLVGCGFAFVTALAALMYLDYGNARRMIQEDRQRNDMARQRNGLPKR